MNRFNLNSLRRLITYSQTTKQLHEANKCVLFMNGTLTKPECGAAGAMISILEVEKVDFREVDIVDVTNSNHNQESIPCIYFSGKSFGGYEELFEAYQNDELKYILLNAGLTIPENQYL